MIVTLVVKVAIFLGLIGAIIYALFVHKWKVKFTSGYHRPPAGANTVPGHYASNLDPYGRPYMVNSFHHH